MTDMSNSTTPQNSLLRQDARTIRRNRAETRFKAYGVAAISVGLLMLVILLVTIIGRGAGAFQQTFLTLDVQLLEAKLDKKGNRDLEDIKKVSTFGYAPLMAAALEKKVAQSDVESDLKPKEMAAVQGRCRATAGLCAGEPRSDRHVGGIQVPDQQPR
jgi:phosphate transport system permease protein